MSKAFTSGFAPAGERRGYHHGNLRETLVDAARFLVAEKGPQGFTLLEAARLVDVSPAAPYRHFKDRDALVAAVAERGFALFSARLTEAFTLPGEPEQRFQAMGLAYLAFAREEPGFYGAMFLAAGTPGVNGPRQDSNAFALLVEAVRRCLDGLAPANPDPVAVAMQVWVLAHGVASLAATGQWPRHLGVPSPEQVLSDGAAAIIAFSRQRRN
jgi:AcrR family transcriptional regulator